MKHYKDTNGDLFAYEEDGSQDHLIPANYVAILKLKQKHLQNSYQHIKIKD